MWKYFTSSESLWGIDVFKVFIDKMNHLNFKRSIYKLYFYKLSKITKIKVDSFVNVDTKIVRSNKIKVIRILPHFQKIRNCLLQGNLKERKGLENSYTH